LERELSDAVAWVVEAQAPQPLARIASRLARCAEERALSFSHATIVAELREVLRERPSIAPLMMRLSWEDASAYSIFAGDGKPDAALRFAWERGGEEGCAEGAESTRDGGEAGRDSSGGSDCLKEVVALLVSVQARHAAIGHADLWALAANVAIEWMGGPRVHTFFGRVDAAASESAPAPRLPSPEGDAAHVREFFRDKGWSDREIVAFAGRQGVGDGEGSLIFDNSFYTELLRSDWKVERAGEGRGTQMVNERGTVRTLSDHALLHDSSFRSLVEEYASDQSLFFSDFTTLWGKMQQMGCTGLKPHPEAFEYAGPCFLPTEWISLTLARRAAHTREVARLTFDLPSTRAVQPCLLVQMEGTGGELRSFYPLARSDSGFEILVHG
ncbi:MAG: hypothetical protein SGPRY_003009, partial [Prymnesium sp.]